MEKKKITIIGCGNMGYAILRAVSSNNDFEVTVVEKEKEKCEKLNDEYDLSIYESISVENISDVYILAVKPQNMGEVLKNLGVVVRGVEKKITIISIAAGITTEYIENSLKGYNNNFSIIRVMPNTPALVSMGITAISSVINEEDLKIVEDIFKFLGETVEIEEEFMDVVTALSGSGPAYFFYIAEIMEKFAVDSGLDKDVAQKLITQTVLGSGEMMLKRNEDYKELRKAVTSPGGTTQAAIEFLESKSFSKIFHEALNKAKIRSEELSERVKD